MAAHMTGDRAVGGPSPLVVPMSSTSRFAVLRQRLVIAAITTVLLACSRGEDSEGTATTGPTTPTTPTTATAKVATLDSIKLPVPAGAVLDPTQQWETNAALYFLLNDLATALSNAGSTIIKYSPAASSVQTNTTPVYASSFRPMLETNDAAASFAVTWVSTPAGKSGSLSFAAGASRTTDFAETGFLHEIIPDRSSTARDWGIGIDALTRWQVVRAPAVVGAKWTTVARPTELGSMAARGVGMPNGKLYLGVGTGMYVLTQSGIERSIPLVAFGSGSLAVVNKIVGGNGGSSVYIGYGTKILRLSTSDGQLSEVVSATFPNPLGSFCVNSGRVYTNGGMKSALNEIGAPTSYVQTTTNVSPGDQPRLVRIKTLLGTGAPMCLNEPMTINASMYVTSGGYGDCGLNRVRNRRVVPIDGGKTPGCGAVDSP